MASYTSQYNLKKPDGTDYYSVTDQNENMDKIDAALAAKLDTNQGSGNSGKFMVVNSAGNIVPTTVPFANGVSF